jgi:hypothetical protein
MFLPPVHAHPPHQHLTNYSRFRIHNILLDTQHSYFTAAWQTEFKECSDFLRYVSPCGFHYTLFLRLVFSCGFQINTLFRREVYPCGFHFTHFSMKYLQVQY